MFETLIPINDLNAIWLTFELATITTILLLLIGTPLSWWLARTSTWFKPFIEAVVTLPLILPPTVLGLYALCLSRQHSWSSLGH